MRRPKEWYSLVAIFTAVCLVSCDIQISEATPAFIPTTDLSTQTIALQVTATPSPTASHEASTETPSATLIATTPDSTRPRDPNLAAMGEGWEAFSYQVQVGEDLGIIGARYGVSIEQMRAANGFNGTEVLLPNQRILIPQRVQSTSPALKLIPDSELVYGPSTVGFDVEAFVNRYKRGYLYGYTEVVNGETITGAQLIQRAAQSYSVNPRLLLALLEYQTGWLTDDAPVGNGLLYPFGRTQGGTERLYRQLGWAATALNAGFYNWREAKLGLLILGDGTRVGLSDGLNAGTVALHYLFSLTTVNETQWNGSVDARGFIRTYTRLFGDPFENAVEPLLPETLTQPELLLPWQGGETWFYSGGPHASFGSGSPWGAVDFLPPGRVAGCAVSPNWVTSAASGVVARSREGQVLLDLDRDGNEQTGWVILYLHLATLDRPETGALLLTGDKVGHASCEGGFAEDAHIHIARKYNGVWLTANDPLAPFVLGGYTLRSTGSEYNGLIEGFGLAHLACACREETNAVVK
jgi:LasA protease